MRFDLTAYRAAMKACLLAVALFLAGTAQAAPPKAANDCGCSHRDACRCQALGQLCLCDGEPVLLVALADPPACPNCANGVCLAPPRKSPVPAPSQHPVTVAHAPAGRVHATSAPARRPITRGFFRRILTRN